MTNESADPAPETVVPPEAAPAAEPSAPAAEPSAPAAEPSAPTAASPAPTASPSTPTDSAPPTGSAPARVPERPGRDSGRERRPDSGDRPDRGGRSDGGDRSDRGGPRRFARRRGCYFCIEKRDFADYKDVELLRRYVGERGKMEPRRKVGNCAKHQRVVSQAIKRARYMALLPYTAEHIRVTGVFGGRR